MKEVSYVNINIFTEAHHIFKNDNIFVNITFVRSIRYNNKTTVCVEATVQKQDKAKIFLFHLLLCYNVNIYIQLICIMSIN